MRKLADIVEATGLVAAVDRMYGVDVDGFDNYTRDDDTTPQKFDGEKIRLELLPPEFLEWTAVGLTYGAKKYAAGNWARGEGFDHSRLYGALQRHLNAYWNGQDIDPESGNHHLMHACCMLSFLVAHVARNKGRDDRKDVGVAP